MVATAIAAALVSAVVGPVLTNAIAQAMKFAEKGYDLLTDFPIDLEFIRDELVMIAAEEADQLAGLGDSSAVSSAHLKQMRALAYDIEDCLDRIQRYTEVKDEASLRQMADEVQELVKRLKRVHQRRTDYNVNGIGNTQVSSAAPSTTVPSRSFQAVGIEESKNQIVEILLRRDAEGQSEKPRVISIVGFGGSGKTTLAKAVYNCNDVVQQFRCRAWVVASEHGGDTKALLNELFRILFPGQKEREEKVELLQTKISKYLSKQRFLIVLDGVKKEKWWNDIESTFSNNNQSRIIVTTTNQAVATVCSRGNGYVHNMKSLDNEHSRKLLLSVLPEHSRSLEQRSTSIVNKCDGHPLSLATVAYSLAKEKVITKEFCKEFTRRLGHSVATEDEFLKLREVLMNNYTSLPGVLPKLCFMYMCVFPNGCLIKRSRLMRRWSAEHYVQDNYPYTTAQEAADEYFKKLVDQNIISPIGTTSKNRRVKSCRAHSIMHEFMLHMAQSAEFISSLDDPKRGIYRHLIRDRGLSASSGRSSNQNHGHNNISTQYRKFVAKARKIFQINNSSPKYKKKKRKELRAHSLTICGKAGNAAGEFVNYELLRVLDLEECNDLQDEDIDGIHELWHLKYLSLGATFSRLPRQIEKLHCLETLDMRKTKKDITLPVAVIKLPHLAHLLGKFKLEKKDWKKNKPENYISKENNLETLAGFVTDDDHGFPLLMVHMEKLKKVKAWCNSVSKELLDAIKVFVQTGANTPHGDRSLSLYLGHLTGNFLSSLESSLGEESSPDNTYGYLSSLKIYGALDAPDRLNLTQFTKLLSGLKVLCLSSTNDLTIVQDDLSHLGELLCLEYLKLVKVSLRDLVIRSLHFKELLCLCLVQCPALPAVVDKGALQNLRSLQLLAEDLGDLSGIKVEQIELLEEVVLDSQVNKETKKNLECAAKGHPKRPRVFYLDRVTEETGSIVKYVATKRPAPEAGSSVLPEEQQIQVQSNSAMEHSSASEQETAPGPSLVPDETGSTVKYVATKRPAPERGSSVLPEEQQIRVQSNSVMELSSALEQATVSGTSRVSDEPCSSWDNGVPYSSGTVSRPV